MQLRGVSTAVFTPQTIMRGGENVEGIEKALQDIAKAVSGNANVERIKITITLKKQVPSKAKTKPKNGK